MVNVRSSMLTLWICAMVTACGARAVCPAQPPPLSPQVFAAKVIPWDSRGTAPLVLPALARHVQLIITPGWAADEHFAWLISNGTDVAVVYRCTASQVAEIVEAANRAFVPTAGSPTDKVGWVILGSTLPPPPPPPYPGGLPGDRVEYLPRGYVQTVVDTAWELNREQAQIEGTAAVH